MGRRYTGDDVVRWYERYQQGLTLKELVREVGASEPTILGEFMRRGFPRRPAVRRSGRRATDAAEWPAGQPAAETTP